MPKAWTMQTNFSSGELDPKLLGRVDLGVYYAGASKAREVTPLIQGGMQRRYGSEYQATTDTQAFRLISFKFSEDEQYLLVFAENRVYIYQDGTTLLTNIGGSGNDYLATTYTEAQIDNLDFAQSADTLIITHPDVAPARIIRQTGVNNWVWVSLSLTNIPQHDFDDSSSPTPTSEIQQIVFANQNTSDRYKLGLEGILTDDIVFSSDQTTNATLIQEALLDLPNTANSGVSVSAVSITTYDVTFSDASAKDWDLLTGTGVATQSASFTVTTTETQQGVPRTEDTWSSTRGWPVTVTFHENRLWFGGSKSRIQTLWGSFANDFFNFDLGVGFDDEGIEATLDTDQINAIQGIFSNRTLQIFTTGQEFYVPSSPVTPSNVSVVSQTNFGSKRVRPITIDGTTLYLQRTGKAIREFVQSSDVTNIYNSNSISILASHIIDNPTRMAAFRGSVEVDANYAYFVNSDGTLLVYNVLGAEEVFGFTLWSLDGYEFTDVTVVNDTLFALVTSSTTSIVVSFEPTSVTDLGVIKTSGSGFTTFTGLDHLEGQTVDIVADGSIYLGQEIVVSGEVEVNTDYTQVECGLRYRPEITTMPLNMPMQNGPNFAEPKKVNRVAIEYFESLGILIRNSQGYEVRLSDKTMGLDVFSAPTPSSGRNNVWLLGWDEEATVTITQEEPVPMTILALAVEVGVQ